MNLFKMIQITLITFFAYCGTVVCYDLPFLSGKGETGWWLQ